MYADVAHWSSQRKSKTANVRNGNPYLPSSIPSSSSSSTSNTTSFCSLILKQVQPAGWSSCRGGTKSAHPVQRFTKTADAVARPSCITSTISFYLFIFLPAHLPCVFTDAVCAGITPPLDKAARCRYLFTFTPEADWQWSEGERMR